MMDPNDNDNSSQDQGDKPNGSSPKDPDHTRGHKRTASVASLEQEDAAGKRVNIGDEDQQVVVINEPVENAEEIGNGRGSPSSESSLEGIEFLINRTTLDDPSCERPDGRREPQQPWLDPSKLFGHIEQEDNDNYEDNVHALRASAATPAPMILNPRVRIPPCASHNAAFIAPPMRFNNYLSGFGENVNFERSTGGAFTACRYNPLCCQMLRPRDEVGARDDQENRDEGIYEDEEMELNVDEENSHGTSSEETHDSAVAIDEEETTSDDKDGGKDMDDSYENQTGNI